MVRCYRSINLEKRPDHNKKQNNLHVSRRNDIYGQTYGSGSFYEEQAAYDAYDARLRFITSYTGKHSGKTWRDWHDVIMAFDLQNEPFAPKTDECSSNGAAAKTWVCGRSDALRAALGADNPIKIASGGFGGDYSKGCSFFEGAMSCSSLDIVAGTLSLLQLLSPQPLTSPPEFMAEMLCDHHSAHTENHGIQLTHNMC